MSYLLTTEDERELTAFLCGEMGARLLLSDLAPVEVPRVADDPLSALPRALPAPLKRGNEVIYSLVFWLPRCGPIKTLGDAPEPADVRHGVARQLTYESAAERLPAVIDLERTPVLVLHRSYWHAPNRLAPGALGSMAIKSSSLPQDVKRAHSKTERWLRARGVKTDPFAHCPQARDRRPRNLGPLWVYVQPHALQWVEQGLEIWPWNA